MNSLDELYENGLYSPKLITEVAIPQWAKLLEYRTPITGIFAIVKKDILSLLLDGHQVHNYLLVATPLTIISDVDEVNFFDRCYDQNLFAIIQTGQVVIEILTAVKVVLSNGTIAYKTRFVAHSDEDPAGTDIKISGISLLIVSKPNADPNQFPDTVHNTKFICEVSGDPDLIDTLSERYMSADTANDNSDINKPSIFGFFGNLVRRKTETSKNNSSKKLNESKTGEIPEPDYDVL